MKDVNIGGYQERRKFVFVPSASLLTGTGRKVIKISKEELNNLYTLKKFSAYEIAKIFNYDVRTIYKRLRKFGISIRSNSEAQKLLTNLPQRFKKGRKNPKWLREKMRNSMIGNKNWLGKHHAEETKQKLRARKISIETKRRMSKATKGKIGENARRWEGDHDSYYHKIGRCIYIKNYGKIPDGYLIHHIDKNMKNNNISNLKMMTRPEHVRIHSHSRKATFLP